MDNPNVKVKNLQRRKSLPGPLRSIRPRRCNSKRPVMRSTKLILSRSNPYVGWFRHAPPVQYYAWAEEVAVSFKKRRHVAKGHHFLTSLQPEERTKTLLYMRLKETFQNNHELKEKFMKRNGFLPGGGTEDEDLEKFLKEQCGETESSSVLFKLACWFLDVPPSSISSDEHAFQPPTKNHLWQEDASSVISADESESSEYDNYDTPGGSRQRSSSLDDSSSGNVLENSAVLSSQAEAYTAFAAVRSQILDGSSSSSSIRNNNSSHRSSSHNDRLDYDITQMDIVRMNRVASRHLDVESIVRLPVVTYQEEEVQPEESRDPQETVQEENDKNKAEFSWMLVPSIQDTHSLDDGTTTTTGEADVVSSSERRDVCVICLEKFVPGDRLRILPCTHSFHVGCIDRWLSGSHSFDDCYTSGCPTCKKHPMQEPLDGSVPSWAFARLGGALARESQLDDA